MAAAIAALPAAAGATGTAASVMTAVSVASSLASMVATIQQGRAQKEQAEYQARIAELSGRREALLLNENLLKTLAMNNASAAAGGLMSAGGVEEAQKANIMKAERELSIIDFNTSNIASASKQTGRNVMASTLASALDTGVGVLSSAYKRKEKIKEVG